MDKFVSEPGFVGIDIGKSHVDVHCLPWGEAFRVTRDPAGLDTLTRRLG